MGCGASAVPKNNCTDEQRRELCAENGRRMLQLCVPQALDKSSEVKVTVPQQLAGFKASANTLRDHAVKLREKKEKEGTSDGGAEEGQEKKAGIGGFMDKVTGAIEGVAEKAGELVGKGVGAALDEAAKALDAAVDKLESPMSTVGRDIVEAKKAEIAKVYEEVIPTVLVDAEVPVALVRGEPPYGLKEYQAVPGSALSDKLTSLSRDKLAEQLEPVVKPALDEHSALKAFSAAMKAHEAAVAASAKLSPSGTALEKVEFDLGKHVIQEVISRLGELIAKEEAEIRKAPGGKWPEDPQIFATVFSGEQLTADTWAGTFKARKGLK
ncbi:unnamed protein product [Prorocentrum cordatum]|uniref:Uncharacterized protein n=1 Tax=Prorocentrum cordatum TaxID=2364126 RepID=A0ABN9TP12_9DINO|nr:unnamed protein product [Polarella glacialis]